MKLNRKTLIERVAQRIPNHVFNELVRSKLIMKQDVETYGKRRLLTMLNDPKNDFIKKYLLVSYIAPNDHKQIFGKYKPEYKFLFPPKVVVKNNRFVFYDVNNDYTFVPPKRKINLTKVISKQYEGLLEKIFKTPHTYKIGTFVMEMVSVMDHTIRIIRYLARHMLKALHGKNYISSTEDMEPLEIKDVKDSVYVSNLNTDVRPHLRDILKFLPTLDEATRRFNNSELTSDINSLSNAVEEVINDLNMVFEDERGMNESDFVNDVLEGTGKTEWAAERVKSGLVKTDFTDIDTTNLHYNKNFPTFESKYMISTIKTIHSQGLVKKYSRKTK